MVIKNLNFVTFFSKLSLKSKLLLLFLSLLLLFSIYGILTDTAKNYSNEESRVARAAALSEENRIKSIHGLKFIKQIMGAKPIKGWGISFIFSYDYSNDSFRSELENLGWHYSGEFEYSDLITNNEKYSQFCKGKIKMHLFSENDNMKSIHIKFNQGSCAL